MTLAVTNPLASAGDVRDMGSNPRPGRSPGEGHGNPLQYSCLAHPMDRGAWQAHKRVRCYLEPKGTHTVLQTLI